MSRRTYGILAGLVGSALGAWWWSRHRVQGAPATPARGRVIFDNTPTATDLSEGVV